MVPPPLEAGYWLGWFAFSCVFILLIMLLKEYCYQNKNHRKLNKHRQKLMGPVTFEPTDVISKLQNNTSDYVFVTKPECAFTLGNPRNCELTSREAKLLRILLGVSDTDPNCKIPNGGVHSVSFVYDGFGYGDNCVDFKPMFEAKPGSHFEYQMLCTKVQMVYFVEGGVRRDAGVTWYFGEFTKSTTDDKKTPTEIENDCNLICIYEIIKDKRIAEHKKLRRKEKEEARQQGFEPLDEYTSSTFSHLRLCTQEDGRTLVLACNADGKTEKYAFNMKNQRYEFVEVEGEAVETGGANYLLRTF